MRLVVVVRAAGWGGADRSAVRVANHFASAGHDVWLATIESARSHYPLGRGVVQLPLRAPFERSIFGWMFAIPALRRALLTVRPDALVSLGTQPNLACLVGTAGLEIPVVVSERSDPRVRAGRRHAWLRNIAYRLWPARAFVVLTEGAAAWARRWMDPARVYVIPNPAPEPEVARESGRLGPPIVVGLGRLVRQKGFDVLIEAFARCVRDHPDWRLRIVGEGRERRALEVRVARLGISDRVELPGFDPDPFGVLAGAEIFVLSSRFEGFANVVIEAMACGVPVVATDCFSGPGEIIRDGVDGLLVPPEDPAALARAMSRLMDDASLRDRMGGRGREVLDRFSGDRIWRSWDRLLRDVTSPPVEARRRTRSSPAVRLLFGALLAGFVLQYPVRIFIAEPYPALFGPSFGSTPKEGVMTRMIPVVTVETDEGSRQAISLDALFEEFASRYRVSQRLLDEPQPFERKDVRAWLCDQLARAGSTAPRRFEVSWEERTYAEDGRLVDARPIEQIRVERPCA